MVFLKREKVRERECLCVREKEKNENWIKRKMKTVYNKNEAREKLLSIFSEMRET